MFFAKPLQRSNLCASHRQRRWLTHGELEVVTAQGAFYKTFSNAELRTVTIDEGVRTCVELRLAILIGDDTG
jgi:hypothetical protein